MGWIYLAVLEDLRSHSKIGYDPSHIVKTTDTPKPFLCHGCGAETFPDPQYGTKCERCEGTFSRPLLISFTGDFHARILAQLDMESAWAASGAAFSSTSQGLPKKQTRDLYFSKTSQQLELVASTVSSKHLPSSGMIVGGQLYQPPKLAGRSLGVGGSFLPRPMTRNNSKGYLPRPTAKHYGSNKGGSKGRVGESRMSIHQMASHGLLPGHPKGALNREYLELVMAFPSRWTEIAAWATGALGLKQRKRL